MKFDQPEFVDLLENPYPSDFATHSCKINKQKHFPTVAETASHLKLLKAFQVYKAKIVGTSPTEFQVKTWQIFLSNAVRRFTLFVTALRKYHKIDDYYKQKLSSNPFFSKTVSGILVPTELQTYNVGVGDSWAREFEGWLPPLDVVMVWHSFMLNPKTFYDVCMRNKFIQFANFPFPLFQLNKAIDNTTFEYFPSLDEMNNYNLIVSRFSTNPGDLVFHIDKFSMYEHLVDIYCPRCQEQLVKVPWTNDENTGFGDEGFLAKITSSSCYCSEDTVVTHDALRKRQLFADLDSDLHMPGVFKYLSHVISKPKLRNTDPIQFSDLLKKNVLRVLSRIDVVVDKDILDQLMSEFVKTIVPRYLNKPSKLILRNYLSMNLIHTTIPHSFQVWEDLVGCCLRQERFVEKMGELNWLNSPVIKEGLSESIVRYSRFLSLLSKYGERDILVPTLDIDLVWHTHQLSMHYYFEHWLTDSGIVIDHDDKIEEGRLDDSFQTTAKLYRSKFKQDYSICFCWYCVATRSGSSSGIKRLFGKPKSNGEADYEKHPLYLSKVGLTHISLHNAIELPSLYADRRRRTVERKYEGKELPWKQERDSSIYAWGGYPGVYVVPPYYPIGPSCSDFYNHGFCCTQDSAGTINCGSSGFSSSGGCGGTGGGGSCGSARGGGCGSGGGGSAGCGNSGSGGCGGSSGGGGGCGGGGGGGCGGGGGGGGC